MEKEGGCCNRILYFLNNDFLKYHRINKILLQNYNKCVSIKNLGKKFNNNCQKYETMVLENIIKV